MLRLAFDFIITWRETRTRPNAYLFSTKYRPSFRRMQTLRIQWYEQIHFSYKTLLHIPISRTFLQSIQPA